MALMNCPECSSQVSSIAVSCSHCGAPIASGGQAVGVPLTTVQETSKRLKIHIIFSSILFWFGFLGFAAEIWHGNPPKQNVLNTSTSVWGIGFVWYLLTRCRIWWHHK